MALNQTLRSCRCVTPVRYTYDKDGFVLRNLCDRQRRFKVDLSSLGDASIKYEPSVGVRSRTIGSEYEVELPAHAEARWLAQP